MVEKKVAILLIVIALVLVVSAVAINVTHAKQMSVESPKIISGNSNGQVGVVILPPNVEDRGTK